MKLSVNKQLIKNIDWFILITAFILCVIGIMTIYSATRPISNEPHSNYYIKQAVWFIVGLVAMMIIVGFDYIRFERIAYILYIIGLALLAAVLVAGRVGMGAQRWLSIGPISFQPSEIFKIFFVIAIARHLSTKRSPLSGFDILRAFVIFTAIPFVLLLKQPDLGTALLILIIFCSLVLTKGIQKKIIVFLMFVAILSVPFLGNIFWDQMKDYQRKRIVAFMDPTIDPAGIGYQIIQSKVAIGSGGLLGKGYLQGTQGRFRFLPEKHTDFIFAVFAEEWGFIGSVTLLMIYLLLIYRGLDTARKAKDEFGKLLATGITFMFTVYVLINSGMTMGLTPIVGIPLPFISYGGTALLGNMIALGVLLNIRANRFELFY